MSSFLKKYTLRTEDNGVHSITDEVKQAINESGIKSGLCVVHCPHTTAGLTITSYIDPNGKQDLSDEIRRLIPSRNDFFHRNDTPVDAAGHVKTALIGTTLTIIVEDGKAMLGSSQGILYLEFDGPRNRQFYVKVMSD